MLNGVSALANIQNIAASQGYAETNATSNIAGQKAKQEFLAIFYKELFKDAFKGPKIGLEEKENVSFSSVYSSDMMAEWLAVKLASTKPFSADSLFPDEKATQIK